MRERRAIGVHHAEQVDLDHALPGAKILRAQRATGCDPRIGHHHVETAQGIGRGIDRLRDLLKAGDVTLAEEGVLAATSGKLRQLVGLEAH